MATPEPTFSQTDLLTLVLEEDDEHYKAEDVYLWSNGRKFKNTDNSGGGPYE